MSEYKYHYEIVDRGGCVIDTAQDMLMRNIMLNFLINYHGLTWYNERGVKAVRKRITKQEWKERYC